MFLRSLTNQNIKSLLLLVWMAVAPLIFSGIIGYQVVCYESQIQGFGPTDWFIIFFLATISMTLALTPTTVVAITTGYFLGFNGILPMVIAYSVASILGFGLSQKFGGNFILKIQKIYPVSKPFFERMHTQSTFWFVVLCRLSPVLPFGIMNVVLAYIGIGVRSFLWGGLWGMLPRTIISIAVGSFAKDLLSLIGHPGQNQLIRTAFISLLIVSGIGLYSYLKRMLNRNSEQSKTITQNTL